MSRNREGYFDPTAALALSRVMRDERNRRRREDGIKRRRKIYVASRFAGDMETNTAAAIRYCRFVIDRGCMPVASHLLYPRMLNDDDPEERLMGTMFGLALLRLCREVWVFGEDISPGMREEVKEARRIGKTVRFFNERCEEVRK